MADCGINNQHYKNVNRQQIKDGSKRPGNCTPDHNQTDIYVTY